MTYAMLKKGLAAGLGMLVVSAAAPIALADPPGYYFQDSTEHSSPDTPSVTARSAPDQQIEAVNEKADHALATAQQALREAQEAVQRRAR